MDFHIYFNFQESERKLIALAVNGEPVGLQTVSFQDKRVYSYLLTEYERSTVKLSITSLTAETEVEVIIENKTFGVSISEKCFLKANQKPFDLNIDLFQLGQQIQEQQPEIEIKDPRPIRFPGKGFGLRVPRKIQLVEAPVTGRELKIDLDFYRNQKKRDELLTAKADDPQNTTVEVFYATDRKREENSKGKILYANERGDLELGKCVVNVPAYRKKGEMPLPPWYLFGLYANENLHMIIKNTALLDVKDFFEGLQQKVSNSPQKDAFIFIHGFNVSFEESVMRTAQIAVDIGFNGAPIVYSWPSLKKVTGYNADEATATGYSIDNIIHFIKDVRTSTGADRVHLIAHSMGNRYLTDALKSLDDQGFTKDFIFNQIILAAPDIDAETFVKNIAPKIAKAGQQVTLYASMHDKALWLSEKLHGNIQRAGTVGTQLAVCEGIDTIDASEEKTDFLGHGYFAESRALIDDIFHAIRFGNSPADRNLRKCISGNVYYWDFN